MKKSVAKWIALLLSVVMIVMCAAGCGKAQTQEPSSDNTADAPAQTADTPAQADEPEQADAPEQAEPVTITFWHTYGDSEEAQFLNVVMPLWETLHPEIKVEAVRQDSSQYHQMIVTSFGTLTVPDVGDCRPANIFNIVDLPAPFLPTRAIRSFLFTTNEMSSKSVKPPNSTVSPSTEIILSL